MHLACIHRSHHIHVAPRIFSEVPGPHHLALRLRPEDHGDLQGDLPDEQSIKTHHIYVSFGLRPPIFSLYRLDYLHIYVYPFFNKVPGWGSVYSAEVRRQCITIVYDGILWNALVVVRASKQHGRVHTFHRSTSSVGVTGANDDFPITRAATELMHDLRRNFPLRFPLLCGFFRVSIHPSGPRLTAPRWVTASCRWVVMTLDLEERNSVQDER
jgi:hypothetical protein